MPRATLSAWIVAVILISPEPSKFAVPTTSPASAIALAFASVVAVSALPVTAPTRLAFSVPSATVRLPVALPVAVVVPIIKRSSVSSQMIAALSPVEPRSIIKPRSLAFELAPVLISIKLSSTTLFVVLSVVVVPLTVRLPVTTASPPIVTSLGRPIWIWLFVTAVSISPDVPANVSVSVPTTTPSAEPLSAPTVSVPAAEIAPSTYAFVDASCALLGSATLVTAFAPMSIVCEPATVKPPSKSALGVNVAVPRIAIASPEPSPRSTAPSSDVLPDTSSVVLTVAAPVTASVLPLNVRLPLSSSSPAVPANTTRPLVRSLTLAVASVALVFAVITVPVTAAGVLPPTIPSIAAVIVPALKLPLPSITIARLTVPSLAKMFASPRSTLRLCATPSPDVAPVEAIPLPPVIVAV